MPKVERVAVRLLCLAASGSEPSSCGGRAASDADQSASCSVGARTEVLGFGVTCKPKGRASVDAASLGSCGSKVFRVHPSRPAAPNLLKRRFSVPAPDVAWVCDISYVRTWEGWLYLAVVIDLYARRVVGYAMTDHMRTELVLEALDAAVAYDAQKPVSSSIRTADPRTPAMPIATLCGV